MEIELPDEVTRDYEVVRSLGVGGQGHTMLARDRRDGSEVVLKTLDFVELSSWKDLELLQREMKVLGSIRHPAIPALIAHYPEDLRDDPEAFVIVQELIEGQTLDQLLEANEAALFDEDDARAFLLEMLGVLEYLHGLNPPVVHRDIKPSNIMRRPTGEYVLIDFGAASATGVLTGSTTFVGTNGYMPPEQLMGRAEPRSDLFALGATTIELMTNISPSTLAKEDLSFRLDVLDAGDEFKNIIRVLTHPSPARRYISATRAIAALQDPGAALVLGSETAHGLELKRQSDGTVVIDITEQGGGAGWTVVTLAALAGCVSIAVGLQAPIVAVVLALFVLAVAYRRLPSPRFELDEEEVRLKWVLGPLHRTTRWRLDSIAEVWSGPVPQKTGLLIQQTDGTQTGLRFRSLNPDQHHWLGDVIRNHREGR